jgi:hypothetical protein
MRRTAVAGGVAAVAGLVLGLAAGEPAERTELAAARTLPSDLCSRLGDVRSLLPKTSTAQSRLLQTGVSDVRCRVEAQENTQPTHTSATLVVTVTPYGERVGGAGAPPILPETAARQAYDRKPWLELKGRPFPTKVERSPYGEEHWRVSVLLVRADLVVQVDYTAHPIARDKAEKAAMVMADRALWEAR